jgi:peptidoglycan/xylan/chitin deacetylase (PgdA/CDA1 family)
MMRLKLARHLASGPWLSALGAVHRRVTWPILTSLTYHRVIDSPGGCLETDDVVDATVGQFAAQMAFLSEHFSFVTAADVVRWRAGGALPKNPVMVSFDDGYLECFTRVLPILEAHHARATFFVSPRYLDERRLFWWERIERILNRSTRPVVTLRHPRPIELRVEGSPTRAIGDALALVKQTPGLDLSRFLGELEEAAGAPYSEAEEVAEVERTLMTWDHVEALERAGMDIESHTQWHRVLHTLSPSELKFELLGSRRELEERLGRPVRAVAYPVGYPVAHLDHVRASLHASGYEVGFTNHSGTSFLRRSTDPYALCRIAMTPTYDASLFPSLMLAPILAPRRSVPRLPSV